MYIVQIKLVLVTLRTLTLYASSKNTTNALFLAGFRDFLQSHPVTFVYLD